MRFSDKVVKGVRQMTHVLVQVENLQNEMGNK